MKFCKLFYDNSVIIMVAAVYVYDACAANSVLYPNITAVCAFPTVLH